MKRDENKKQKIGVLAQDIEKVFPELVSESNGVKSVNYQGLVPVLINALKEQDSKMNEQDTKLNKQQAEINKLRKTDVFLDGSLKKNLAALNPGEAKCEDWRRTCFSRREEHEWDYKSPIGNMNTPMMRMEI